MSILDVRKFPDKALRQKASPVGAVTDAERKLIQDMFETMYFANGVGLAAPQVGVSKRIIVCNPTGDKVDGLAVINPGITYKKSKKFKDCEGCLSVPGLTAEVVRFSKIGVKGRDINGRDVAFEAEGLLARIIQHETDHLDGILFIDRLGLIQRKRLIGKYKKENKITCVGRWY